MYILSFFCRHDEEVLEDRKIVKDYIDMFMISDGLYNDELLDEHLAYASCRHMRTAVFASMWKNLENGNLKVLLVFQMFH